MLSRSAVVALSFAIAAASCSSQPFQETLKDTTGVTFQVTCPSNHCDITSTGATPTPCNGWTIFKSRVAVMCASTSGASVASACRPFACTADSDCPQAQGWTLVCEAAICQDLGSALLWDDVVALCLATTPRSADCAIQPPYADPAIQTAYDEATAACTSTSACTVPAGCLQP